MDKKMKVMATLIVTLAIGFVVTGTKCLLLGRRVHELECAQIAAKAANKVVSTPCKTEDEGCRLETEDENPVADVESEDEELPPQMDVEGVCLVSDTVLDVVLSERPDMEAVRSYVTVEPMAEGRPTFEYKAKYNYANQCYEPHLKISGEFAFRTNVTLCIRKGLPLYGQGRNPEATGSLQEDFTYTFQRPDLDPYVRYAADGRYLPPVGKRAVEIESVNATNVFVGIRRVEPRNVVQMLAREEGEYGRCPDGCSADSDEMKELAGEVATNVVRCACRVNEKVKTPFRVGMGDGKPANGIYLLEIHNEDLPVCNWSWEGDKLNPQRYRVVCVSDLGLSVRKNGTDDWGVWVTSLTHGTPVARALVEVYSSANVKVMEGLTDANGWCRVKRIDKGEPFAVVAIAPDGGDMSFLALRASMTVDETYSDGGREAYLKAGEVKAFVWTERGIYRHGERIFLQAILRDKDRRAPKPLPVVLELVDPKGDVLTRKTVVSDADGTVTCETFAVPDEQPSGKWRVRARLPGEDGVTIGERGISIEEFAPPQIRVRVTADASAHPSNFTFSVAAEHLFGGPAHGLRCQGAVVFEDVPFDPAGWKGWHFGNEDLGLKPCYREVGDGMLDTNGTFRFDAPLWANAGRPKAAVRVTGQGMVFEDGGRPATMRASHVLHYYPCYVGSPLPSWLKLERGVRPRVMLACVRPDGRLIGGPRRLTAQLERIDSVYSYSQRDDGWNTWNCERIRVPVAEDLQVDTATNGLATLELPVANCGDYALTVVDAETGASFGKSFYLSNWGDDAVRAPLENPTAVTIVPNKAFYRVGETPRLTVKAPFAGCALLSVMREKEVYTQVLALTNATSEIVLHPVEAADAPNLDVYLSVVQSVSANAKHLAARAHGQVTVRVRPKEDEIPVSAKVQIVDLKSVDVVIDAPGADSAVVTVVDEAINLLTDESTPDPVGRFAEPCAAEHPLYDLYHRVLPVVGEESLRASGVKTGGGFGAEMLGRVSPTPTRRFKPLALWSGKVAIRDGKGRTSIKLPEFVGEVRVTVVAYSATATGAASVQKKVTPKIVTMPDAPRFVAPGDEFDVSLPVYNRAAGEVTFEFDISCAGKTVARQSLVRLAKDGSTNIVTRMKAGAEPGEMDILYRVRGAGEVHDQTIHLPVRPAVAWVETAGVEKLKADELGMGRNELKAAKGWSACRVFDSPVGELAPALEWLAEYPYGCLEQTASQMFPLVTAGEILAAAGSPATSNLQAYVAAGVVRIESMVRKNGFVMWPDCNYPPWDDEVSLYAAHFLVEAERSGQKLNPEKRTQVLEYLKRWAMSTNTAVSAYACHTLALAGRPEKDRMFRLYDGRDKLAIVSRARLARAFAMIHDRPRAEELLKSLSQPDSVRNASFQVLALLAVDPDDARILPLVNYLLANRDRESSRWQTTDENAHALLAIGAYYGCHPPKPGEKFAVWQQLTLPALADVRDESSGIGVSRRFLTPEGRPVDTNAFRRGAMLVAELSVTADDSRWLSDLVLEDLFAGAFEPVHGELPPTIVPGTNEVSVSSWVMRSDVRDDRMLVFSKRFYLQKGCKATFRYPLRVVSSGEYVLPGASVEAMYFPSMRGKCAPSRISVEK